MKRIAYILFIAAAAFLASCGETGKTDKAANITGTWELIDIEITKAAQLGDQTISVTITFNSDKTFAMTQKLGEGRAKDYTGTWSLSENILTGKYSDGKTFGGGSYHVSVEGSTLTMTPAEIEGAESYVYKKK